jgi:hypothetical protein
MPAKRPGPEYLGHWEVRRVSRAGTFRFKGQLRFISQALGGEHIALEEIEEGIWNLHFYKELLGRLEESSGWIYP